MLKNIYFTWLLCAVLFGIFIYSFLDDVFLCIILEIFFTLCISIFLYWKKKQLMWVVLFLCIVSIGGNIYASVFSSYIQQNQSIIDRYSGQYVPLIWQVKSVYKRSDYYDEYKMELSQIQDTRINRNVFFILRVPKNFHLWVGQEIKAQWKIYMYENKEGFSYKNNMLSQGIYFSSSTQNIDTLSINNSVFFTSLFTVREKLLSIISQIFPQEEAIFLWWILFWARENIPQDLKQDFNNSWLTHFIAVSGFNITLCIIFVTFLFWFLPTWGRIIAVSFTIVLFSFFVWLGAPVVRAAIMWIVGYTFLQTWNTAKNMTLLAFTAVCMALWSPLSLRYDVSLHLSFLAVIGIIYTQQYFKKLLSWVPEVFAIQEASVLTLSALSFSLPIMIFQFWQVSLLSPFANIAITWTIPLAMLWWSITILWSLVSPVLWQVFGFFTWILLHYAIWVVRFFWNLEFTLWKIDVWQYGIYLETLYFIILIYILLLAHLHAKKQLF